MLEDLLAGVKRESSGAMSVNLSLGNCHLDDLRSSLEKDGGSDEEKEEEEDEEGSTRESSVDVVAVPEKEPTELRIRRYI